MTATRPAILAWRNLPPDPVCDCGHPIDMHDDGACPTTSTDCEFCLGDLGEVFARVYSFRLGKYVSVWVQCPCKQGA